MVMLHRKTLRDIKENKGVYLACTIVIAIGLMVFTSMSMVLENLQTAQENFYLQSNFADGFISLSGMPQSKVRSLAEYPGIKAAEGRIVKDVRVADEQITIRTDNQANQPKNKPSSTKYLRLVSLDVEHGSNINRLTLVSGQWPKNHKPEIFLDPKFLAANHLALGDQVTVILDGKQVSFTVTGTAQSPEFIYAMRTAQDLFPDPAAFGIAYVPLTTLEGLVKEKGQFNDIIFTLASGASFATVKDNLLTELKKYGVQSIIPRQDQTSHAILNSELAQLKRTTRTLPLVFLGVAAIILYTMLRRLIEQQRVQIGTLQAFGFTKRKIILHYLSYPLLIGTVGGLAGGLGGIALAFPLTSMYKEFFALPGLKSEFSFKYLFLGLALSLFFSVLSGIKGSLDILRLHPAEAMRPPAPGSSRKTIIERVGGLWQRLSSQAQMGIRNAFRSPTRSLFTVIGIAVIFSLMTVSWSMQNMTDLLTRFQFEEVQRYDAKITLAKPLPAEQIKRILAQEHTVSKVEPLLEVPVTLKHGWLKKDVAVLGLSKNSTLYNILDNNGKRVEVPDQGILLSEHLAQVLNVKTGDFVYVESPWRQEFLGEKGTYLRVAGVVPQYVGLNAFMQDTELQNFLRQGPITTSVLLAMDEAGIRELKEKYKDAANVAAIESLKETSQKILEMIKSYGFTTWILALLAGIAGFALIYNSSIISLSERQRELASLRVLGLTPREVLRVITSEQWLLCLAGIILGIPLSYGMQTAMAQSLSSDLYSIPAQLPFSALVGAALGTCFSVWVAQTRAYRKVRTLPFVEILATRD